MANKTVSTVTGTANQAQTTAFELNAFATDFVPAGIVGTYTFNTGSGGTGAFAVNAQSSPNMTVRTTQGVAYVRATPVGDQSQTIRMSMDAFEDVTIANNTTGGTRYDWIYIKIDPTNLATPSTAKDNVATLFVSRSTSNSSDSGAPTYGLHIATVTVANSATSIANANITDSRVQAAALPDSSVAASKLVGANLYGRGSTYTSSPAPPSAPAGQFYTQVGTEVITFSGGLSSITFPVAFPNGLVSAVAMQGDNTLTNASIEIQSGSNKTTLGLVSNVNGVGRINYIAYGF